MKNFSVEVTRRYTIWHVRYMRDDAMLEHRLYFLWLNDKR